VTYFVTWVNTDIVCLFSDIPTSTLLHLSQWTAMDCAYIVHCTNLQFYIIPQSHVLQQRQLLCVLWHCQRLLWR